MPTSPNNYVYLREGEAAFRNGVPYEDCPYPVGSGGPRNAWRKGWRTEWRHNLNNSPYRSKPADLGEKRHAGHSGVKGRIG